MAQAVYTYDPGKIAEGGKDQMRFELGDVMVDGGAETCAMSDAEYEAVIGSTPRWKKAKLRCIESILSRFAYEVDTKVGEMTLSLSKRVEVWAKMRDELKRDLGHAAPLASPQAISADHYFYAGMMDNQRAGGTEGSGHEAHNIPSTR